MIVRLLLLLAIAFALHGCGDASSDTGPGGVGADDARQLDEAAAKLDAESQPASESGKRAN